VQLEGITMTNPTQDAEGNKFWYNEQGQLHREDGPAVELANGTIKWYKNGVRHREAEPAVVCVDGHKEWWLNNQRHREDGPAVIEADGSKFWFINGVRQNKYEMMRNKVFAIETNLDPLDKRIKENRVEEALEITVEIRSSIEELKALLKGN
jgi:hypothetical protein